MNGAHYIYTQHGRQQCRHSPVYSIFLHLQQAASWKGGNCPPPCLNFSLGENKFSSKNTKYGAENLPFWGNLGAELNY